MRKDSAHWRRAGAREEVSNRRTRARPAPRAAHFALLHQLSQALGSHLSHQEQAIGSLHGRGVARVHRRGHRQRAGVVSPSSLGVAALSRNGEREDVRRAGVRLLNEQEEQPCCSHALSLGGVAV